MSFAMRAEFLLLLAGLVSGAASAMTVGEALRMAADRDPAVASSRAALAAESESGEQERSSLRPTLAGVANGTFSRSDSDFAFGTAKDQYPSWAAYLRARQALLRFDWSARGDRADARDATARENFDAKTTDFIARVCRRYLDTLLAEDAFDQAQSEARAVRESLSDTQKRYDVELVPGTDLKDAQARDDLAQAQIVAAQSGMEDARDALYEITGYDRLPLPRLRENLNYPPLDPPDIEGWIQLAGADGSPVRLAELRLTIAKTELKSRRANALPSADLIAEVGRNDSKEYALGQRQDEAKIGVELNIPIYGAGYNSSRIREAEARVEEAQAERVRIRLETEREVRTAFRSVQTSRAEELAYGQALASATLAETASGAGYDAGTRTISDVLDAKSRVVQARRNRNAARYTLLIRLLTLNAIAGTLTVQQVAALDVLFESRSP